MSEVTVFGKSKAEIGSIFESISSLTDKNHPSSKGGCNSLKFLDDGIEILSNDSEAKKTFGVRL